MVLLVISLRPKVLEFLACITLMLKTRVKLNGQCLIHNPRVMLGKAPLNQLIRLLGSRGDFIFLYRLGR